MELLKENEKIISIFEIEDSIDNLLYSNREDYDLKQNYQETRTALLKYLKIIRYAEAENYYTDFIRFRRIEQNKQRKQRMAYLEMLAKHNLNEKLLDKFVQIGCLNDLRYLDQILFMIDAWFLDIDDVLYNLSKDEVIPIIDPTIKFRNIRSKDHKFGTYCENQRDSFIDRLGRQKTI